MADAVTPWWQEVDDAVDSLVAALTTAAARAEARSARKRPRGRPRPKRRAKSTRRHLAEVIRSHRLARGVAVDRSTIAALFAGHRGLVTNPVLIVAVAQACAIVAGRKLTAKEAARLRSASARIAKLIARAEAADRRALAPAPPPVPIPPPVHVSVPAPASVQAPPPPVVSVPAAAAAALAPVAPRRRGLRYRRRLVALAAVLLAATAALVTVRLADPGPSGACREGTRPGEVVAAPPGGQAVPTTPALAFDDLHATVWRADRQGRTYYWATAGHAGPAAVRPASGGARIRWQLDTGGTWHDCAASFPAGARDDAPTPAVATVAAGRPVRLEACLWRDSPFREQCTAIAA